MKCWKVIQIFKVHLNKYCVYHHCIGGVVFYIGSGNFSRPFSFKGRGPNWNKFVAESNIEFIEIRIVAVFSKEKEARAFEIEEISKIYPAANMTHSRPKKITSLDKIKYSSTSYPWKHRQKAAHIP